MNNKLTLTQVLGELYDSGRVAWMLEHVVDEYHEVLCLIGDDGKEIVVDLSIDSNALYVERILSGNIDIVQHPKITSILYIALATANLQLCDGSHFGTCHMHSSTDGINFIYSSPIPLLNILNAELAAALVIEALSAISLVEPYFKYIEKRANASQLTINDVFQFRKSQEQGGDHYET